jgi:hypothetical protein
VTALILLRFASMPLVETRQPRTFPFVIPNMHFSGLSLSLASCIFVKFSASGDVISPLLADHDYVVYIRWHVFAHLILQSCLHHFVEC